MSTKPTPPGTPDQTLPGQAPGVDNTLPPGFTGEIDNTLPGGPGIVLPGNELPPNFPPLTVGMSIPATAEVFTGGVIVLRLQIPKPKK